MKGRACRDYICSFFVLFVFKDLLDGLFKTFFKYLLIETHCRLAAGHCPSLEHHSPGSHKCSCCYIGTNSSQLLPPPLPAPIFCAPDMHVSLWWNKKEYLPNNSVTHFCLCFEFYEPSSFSRNSKPVQKTRTG